MNRIGTVLDNLRKVTHMGIKVSGGVKAGLSLFWQTKNTFENVLIYSDQQAVYKTLGYYTDNGLISIDPILDRDAYCSDSTNKINLITIQITSGAEYVLPDFFYRGMALSGSTGRDAELVNELAYIWDEIEEIP